MSEAGGKHYGDKVQPWDLQRYMPSSGNAFVDARRADAIKYSFRKKGDNEKLLDDLKKARHCLDAAISYMETATKHNVIGENNPVNVCAITHNEENAKSFRIITSSGGNSYGICKICGSDWP